MNIIFASNNANKLEQVRLLLKNEKVLMPRDVGISDFDVVEDGQTLRENAYKKAKSLYDLTGKKVFSDDTGLYVRALDGRPGIYSHRYAGENCSDKDNRDKLLDELNGKDNRSAYFSTVICFIDEDEHVYYFEGRLNGLITKKEYGNGGFGYDKIFFVKEYQKTLGQMSTEFKNQISHRGKACKLFKEFLEEKYEDINN